MFFSLIKILFFLIILPIKIYAFLQLDFDNHTQDSVMLEYCIQYENKSCDQQSIIISSGTTYRVNLPTCDEKTKHAMLYILRITKVISKDSQVQNNYDTSAAIDVSLSCLLDLNFPALLAKNLSIQINTSGIVCNEPVKGVGKSKILQPIERSYKKIYPPKWNTH